VLLRDIEATSPAVLAPTEEDPMTGPEHYRAAEKLLEEAEEHPSSSINKTASLIGQAQVHATPALVAATALNFDNREWIEVAGRKFDS
jgi:hypothetical protein